MFSQIKSLINSEKGSVLVLVAAALISFTAFTAIVTDAGLLYLNHIKLVNALDSAVLAGVQELPQDPDRALQTALDYAALNGVELMIVLLRFLKIIMP
jgi:Flp pilus assembly protein TadG